MEKKLMIYELNDKSFKNYGRVIGKPDRTPDGSQDRFSWWREIVTEQLPENATFGFLETYKKDKSKVTFLERHSDTSEIIVVLKGDVVLTLATGDEDSPSPDLDSVKAFRVPEGSAVMLWKGTWHFAPVPVDKDSQALIVFEKDTDKNDLLVVELEEELEL